MKIGVGLFVLVSLLLGAFLAFNSFTHQDAEVVEVEVSSGQLVQRLAVMAEEVNYFETTNGYIAEPVLFGEYPGVVMIHENHGLRPEIKQAAEDLAAQGYRVLAVDLFSGLVMETQEEAQAFSLEYDAAAGISNMQAAVEHLRSSGSAKVAALGWSFGGAKSLALSASGIGIDATVIYYGHLSDDVAKLTAIDSPVLGIFGDKDQVVSVSSVERFEQNLATLGVDNEIHLYEGVVHAFANPTNPNFAETEAEDAWSKTLAFLEKHLQ